MIALLQLNTFSTLPTDDENISDEKENEPKYGRRICGSALLGAHGPSPF